MCRWLCWSGARRSAQCFGPAGFTPGERLRARNGSSTAPALVHAMGPKPWLRGGTVPKVLRGGEPPLTRLRNYYDFFALEVSPYTVAARAYAAGLDESTEWMGLASRWGKLLRRLGGRSMFMSGFPLAIVDHAARSLRKALSMGRYGQHQDSILTDRPF